MKMILAYLLRSMVLAAMMIITRVAVEYAVDELLIIDRQLIIWGVLMGLIFGVKRWPFLDRKTQS